MAEWCPHFRLPPSYFVSVFLASLAFLFCFFKREFIISSSWKNNKINGTFIEIAIVISLSCLFFPYNNLECISIFVNSLFKCFIVFFFFFYRFCSSFSVYLYVFVFFFFLLLCLLLPSLPPSSLWYIDISVLMSIRIIFKSAEK